MAATSLPGWGQTIPNPSFEADAFGTYPGYISANTPITGWTGLPTTRVGVNSSAGPFADNGTIPNGSKVAFLQSSSTDGPTTLSTVITGLTNGQKYVVNFRLNARGVQQPVLKIGIDGQLVASLSTTGVGGTAAYRYAAFHFTAAGTTAALSLTNDVAGDTTALVDDFAIAPAASGWSFAAWTDDTTAGVDNTKQFTHAYNFGASPSDATINGVTFRALAGGSPAINNEFRITGIGNTFGNEDNNVTTGGSGTLARQFIYGGNPGTFSIMGLVPGTEYVATIYAMAWENGYRAQTFSVGNDRITINEDYFGENNGIRIMYRYTAPANGVLAITQTPTLPGNSLHLYGFANYEAVTATNPVVGLPPRSQTVVVGSTASFKVIAGGALPLAYQWYNNGVLLTDQTNRSLTVSNLTVAEVGPYYVTVSNSYGVVTSSSAGLTFGPIANPSFETDTFDNYPGYVSGNFAISGWTVSDPARVGLNPTSDGQAPFVNTGTIPNGQQAAFIQYGTAAVSLSTVMSGLNPGTQYFLNFRANARSYNNTKPILRVGIDGQPIGDVRLLAVDGTNAWVAVSLPFTPATANPTLSLTNDAADTALVDDFSVVPRATSWSYAAWSDDATSGVDPTKGYSHAYNFGGAGLAVDATINGVRFSGVPGANPAVSNAFATANLTGAFGAHSNALITAGGGSALLGQSFVYFGGTIPAATAQSLTLTNLVPGVEYLATIFGVGFDDRAYARSATFAVGEDRLTINEDAFGITAGIRVSYRYVADASGAITLNYFPTERSSSFHTYAFCNQELASAQPPVIYRHPVGRTVAGGLTVVLDSLVGGQTPLAYQWRKDGVDLPDQTNQVLTLASVDGGATGGYTLVASNALGMVTSRVAVVEVGLAMVNPSFEADTFAVYPGYISANTPITGWTCSLPAQMGINPANGSPFANTGTIPDGIKVAFIQADGGVLSQVINGMVAGRTYYLKYYENCRGGYASATMTVTLGGTTIVPAHTVYPGEYRQLISGPFLATTTSAELAFLKSPGPDGGDSTALIDSVAVLELPPTPPQFLLQPQGAYLPQGDAISLVSMAQGTLPMSYRWQRNGADLPGALDSTLGFTSLSLGDGGTYTVIASNQFGLATSVVATVQVGLPFAELYNTGVGNDGVFLEGGLVDPHYQLIASADPSFPGPAALTLYNNTWPVQVGTYMTNGAKSSWISPRTNSSEGNLVGDYVYRTTFLLDTTDPATARLEGKWAMDNLGVDIRLNGVSLGLTNSAGFAAFASFVITNGFVAGSNTLDVVINNAGTPGPTAMRVELRGVAMPLAGVVPQLAGEPADATVNEQQDVRLTALAIGSAPLSYQWYYEGFLLPGQTGRRLVLDRVSADQAGGYTVVVSNLLGAVTSRVAQLTVLQPPIIDVDPQSQAVQLTSNAVFEVQINAASALPLSYQWYGNAALLVGATNSVLVVSNVSASSTGDYQVVVANVAGFATSAVAVLTIANSAPVAADYGMAMRMGTTGVVAAIKVLGSVTDLDGDPLTLVSVSATSTNGGAVQLTDNMITYTPLPGFIGVDRFTYTVSDGNLTASANVVVWVVDGNVPSANMISITTIPGGYRIRFAGIPGRTYQIQRAAVIAGPWDTLETRPAPIHGLIDYDDLAPLSDEAFYRLVSPQ